MRVATLALVDFIRGTRILRGLPCPVKPIRLVGQGDTDSFFMTESEQKAALKRFREGRVLPQWKKQKKNWLYHYKDCMVAYTAIQHMSYGIFSLWVTELRVMASLL